jgi:hypothetical protein
MTYLLHLDIASRVDTVKRADVVDVQLAKCDFVPENVPFVVVV